MSCVWRPCASEFGKKQTGIDESEKQAEVADRIEMECARRRRLAGGVGNKQRNGNAEIVCERRLRQRARHRDEGAVSGLSVGNRREQSIVPQTEAVVSRKRNLWSLRPTMLGLGND